MPYSCLFSALAFRLLLLRTSTRLRGFAALTASVVMVPFAALAQPSLPAPAVQNDAASASLHAPQVQTVDVSLRLEPRSSVDSLHAAAIAQARARAMDSVPNASLLASHLKADDHSEAVTVVWAALVRPTLVSVSVRQADGEQWADFRFAVSVDTSEVHRQVQHLQASGALQHLAYVQGARVNAAAQALVSGADLPLSSGSQLVQQLRGLLDALRASSTWDIESPEVKSEREQALAQWKLQQPVRRSYPLSLGTPWSMDELGRMPPPALLSAPERLDWELLVTKALAEQLRNAGPRTNTAVTPTGLVFPRGSLLDLALLQDTGGVYLEAMEVNVFDQLLRSRVDVRLLNTARLADGRVHVALAVRVTPPSARAVTTPRSLLFAVPEIRGMPEPGRGLRAFADGPRHCGRVDKQVHGSLWQALLDRAVTLTLTVGKSRTQLHLAGMNSSGLFCVYLPEERGDRETWRTVSVSLSVSEAETAGSVVATISRR
jgi:hypothetical protein